jgi:hypothetical protein
MRASRSKRAIASPPDTANNQLTPAPSKRRLFIFILFERLPPSPRFQRRAKPDLSARDGDPKARLRSFLSFDALRLLRATDKLAMLPFGNDI